MMGAGIIGTICIVFVEMVRICVLLSLDVCCIKRCKRLEPTYQLLAPC